MSPAPRAQRWLESLLVFVVAALVFHLNYRSLLGGVQDEGIALYGSLRVAQGDVPYRDFWTNYGPGTFYLNALAFKIFGASMGVARNVWAALEALVVVEAFVLGRMWRGRIVGWLAFGLALTHTIAVTPIPGHSAVPALAVGLGAVITLMLARPTWLTGVLIGTTMVFRHDFGAGVAGAAIAGLVIRGAALHQSIGRAVAPLAAGVLAVAVPAYGSLAVAAGLPPMIDQLLVYPLTIWPAYHRLPVFGTPEPLLLIPLAMLASTLLAIFLHVRTEPRRFADRPVFLATLLGLLGLGLFGYAAGRFDDQHEWPMMIASVPLLAAAPFVFRPVLLRAAAAVAVLGLLAVNSAMAVEIMYRNVTRPAVAVESPRAGGITLPMVGAYYNDLLRDLTSATRPGQPIFSGVLHHDRYSLNDVLVYFLADRPAPTPRHWLGRGVVDTARVQAEIIQALEARHVRVLVLMDVASTEPNLSSRSSGVTLLDQYIRDHFAPIARYGEYQLWRRRPEVEPDRPPPTS